MKTNNNSINMSEAKIIPIVFCVDEKYAKYLPITLLSLIEHASQDLIYQINIIADKLSNTILNFLEQISSLNPHIRIVLIDINTIITKEIKDILWVSNHLSKATYYRMLVPRIFNNYSKVLYLDVDIIILADVAQLYNYDISEKSFGVIRDVLVILISNNHEEHRDYNNNILKIMDIDNYFNAGIMLFNIKKLIKGNFEEKFIEKLKEIKTPKFHDQDILNSLYNKDIELVDPAWNVIWHNKYWEDRVSFLPKQIKNDYLKAYKSPKIIHYITDIKPWNSPHLEYADKWWHYARQTPFYEEILFENIEKKSKANYQHEIEQLKDHIQLIQKALNIPNSKVYNLIIRKKKKKYYKYKILSKILFGYFRQKYKDKRKLLKSEIRNIKNNLIK